MSGKCQATYICGSGKKNTRKKINLEIQSNVLRCFNSGERAVDTIRVLSLTPRLIKNLQNYKQTVHKIDFKGRHFKWHLY